MTAPCRSTRPRAGYRDVPTHVRIMRQTGSLPPPFVDPKPVQAHLATLCGWGLTDTAIARAAGVSAYTITNLRTGRWTRARREVAEAALSVTHLPHPAQPLVLTVGARRRVQALMCTGWTYDDLSTELGMVAPSNVRACIRSTLMTYPNWVLIRDLYDRLQMVPGTSATTRRRALAAGWAPPLDWDDDTIDDPAAGPWVEPAHPDPYLDEVLLLRILRLRTITNQPRLGFPTHTVSAGTQPIRVPARDRPLYVHALTARGWSETEVVYALGISSNTYTSDVHRLKGLA